MGYSILIVDDSEIIRSMVTRTISLTKLPIQTFYEAKNGKEALDILNEHWIDIIFSDLNMPVVSGFELIKTIKDTAALNDIPIIVITTEGNAQRLDDLKQMGVKECLRKPFTPERIRDIITQYLGAWDEK
jgi:two-component system chemotaxis response regulator CheY